MGREIHGNMGFEDMGGVGVPEEEISRELPNWLGLSHKQYEMAIKLYEKTLSEGPKLLNGFYHKYNAPDGIRNDITALWNDDESRLKVWGYNHSSIRLDAGPLKSQDPQEAVALMQVILWNLVEDNPGVQIEVDESGDDFVYKKSGIFQISRYGEMNLAVRSNEPGRELNDRIQIAYHPGYGGALVFLYSVGDVDGKLERMDRIQSEREDMDRLLKDLQPDHLLARASASSLDSLVLLSGKKHTVSRYEFEDGRQLNRLLGFLDMNYSISTPTDEEGEDIYTFTASTAGESWGTIVLRQESSDEGSEGWTLVLDASGEENQKAIRQIRKRMIYNAVVDVFRSKFLNSSTEKWFMPELIDVNNSVARIMVPESMRVSQEEFLDARQDALRAIASLPVAQDIFEIFKRGDVSQEIYAVDAEALGSFAIDPPGKRDGASIEELDTVLVLVERDIHGEPKVAGLAPLGVRVEKIVRAS